MRPEAPQFPGATSDSVKQVWKITGLHTPYGQMTGLRLKMTGLRLELGFSVCMPPLRGVTFRPRCRWRRCGGLCKQRQETVSETKCMQGVGRPTLGLMPASPRPNSRP